jgi:type I restriction enzyme M protein
MLSAGIEYAAELNDKAIIEVYGQELNEKTYAICKSDTMIKGKGYENIHLGNSFTDDALPKEHFHYMLCNPPFGVEWKKYEGFIRDEAAYKGLAGRFGAGLPRISDGSLLFLQNMISKMLPPDEGGSRIGIVFNGSPLFTGDAGSGESGIRRWIIENDLLETIIALPEQLFYNTPIFTFIWIVTNRKSTLRKGKIQLIDGISFFKRMRKPLWKKRKMLTEEHIEDLTRIYGTFVNSEYCKVFDNDDFAYRKITIERPLRLNFQTSSERIEYLQKQIVFISLIKRSERKPKKTAKQVIESENQQETILSVLRSFDNSLIYKNRKVFSTLFIKALKRTGLSVKTPLLKAILIGLSKKDESAEICTDTKGNPEPDTDLRNTKNVSWKEAVEVYMKREIIPYTPDAWVDHSKTKKGYEIPFTRLFYKYSDKVISASASKKLKTMETSICDNLHQLSFDSEWLLKGIDHHDMIRNNDLDWIDEVPSHWTVVKSKRIFQLRETRGNNIEIQLAATQKYGMYPQDEIEGVVQVKEDTNLQTFRTVHKNDFVISLRSFQGGFEMSDYEGVCSPAYQVFFNKSEIYHPYFKMLFKSAAFVEKINSLTIGIRDGKNILFDDFAEMFIPVPPVNEQKKIVDYITSVITDIETVLSSSISTNSTSLLGNVEIVANSDSEEDSIDGN